MRGPRIKSGGAPRILGNHVSLVSSCADLIRASMAVRHDGNTWMPRSSRGMTTRGNASAETAPHHESGIRRSPNLMRDSPGLGGIPRDKAGSSEISGIPRNVFCSRVAQVPARRSRHRAPNERGQCVAPCNIRRTRCPHPVMRGHARTRSGYPRIHMATPPATAHSLADHGAILAPAPRFVHRIMVRVTGSRRARSLPYIVMRGLDPRISLTRTHWTLGKHVDGRVKPGHDEEGVWSRALRMREMKN